MTQQATPSDDAIATASDSASAPVDDRPVEEPASSPTRARRRTLTDAKEIRALAHPVRVAMLDALRREGTLTATEAADLLDESPANCSFHLRTLAKYGYVEEAPGGTGRQRPWRRVDLGLSYGLEQPSPEVGAAARELDQHFRDQRQREIEVWEATWQSYPKEWRDASFSFQGLTYLTAAELAEINEQLIGLIDQFRERLDDPSKRPPDAHPVSINAGAHPLPRSKRGN